MKKQTVKFLDYEIVNTGNSDGWVLKKPDTTYDNLWECHLGNFSDVEVAKKWAVLHFMIARPAVFNASLIYRLTGGTGAYHEWFTFKKVIEKEGIPMPEEITCSDDMNFGIMFKGERI